MLSNVSASSLTLYGILMEFKEKFYFLFFYMIILNIYELNLLQLI